MKISFLPAVELGQQDCLVIGMFEEGDLLLAKGSAGLEFIKHAITTMAFKGKKAETLSLVPPIETKGGQILVVGLGKPEKITTQVLQEIGAKVISCLQKSQFKRVIFDIQAEQLGGFRDVAAYIASGAQLRNWKFDIYKTKKKDPSLLEELIVIDRKSVV